MTDNEWLTSDDPIAMLKYLRNKVRVQDRKYRQFAVACCRRLIVNFPTRRNRLLLALAEDYLEVPTTQNHRWMNSPFRWPVTRIRWKRL